MRYTIGWVFLFLVPGGQFLRSQPIIEIKTDRAVINAGLYLDCYVDSSAELSISSVLDVYKEGHFQHSLQFVPNIGISTAALWLKFRIRNSSTQDCYLELANNGWVC